MRLGELHVDCLMGATGFEFDILSRALTVNLGSLSLKVPTPEDFIILKLIVGREKDLIDAKVVALRHHQNLDVIHMRKWAQNFRSVRADSQVQERLENLLNDISGIR